MNLYQATSPQIGNEVILVIAENPQQAAKHAAEHAIENRMTDDNFLNVRIDEFMQPDEPGVCEHLVNHGFFMINP